METGQAERTSVDLVQSARRALRAIEERRDTLNRRLEEARRGAGSGGDIESQIGAIEALKAECAECERELERARERVPLVMDAALPGRRAERLAIVATLERESSELDPQWLESSRRLEGIDAELARIRAEARDHHLDIEARMSAIATRRHRLALNGARAVRVDDVAAAVPWNPPDGVLITGTAWREALAVLHTAAGVTWATLTVDENTGRVSKIVTPAGVWGPDSGGALVRRQARGPEPSDSTAPESARVIELSPEMHRASRG